MVYVHNEKTQNNDIFTILNCFRERERERERERVREGAHFNLIIYQF